MRVFFLRAPVGQFRPMGHGTGPRVEDTPWRGAFFPPKAKGLCLWCSPPVRAVAMEACWWRISPEMPCQPPDYPLREQCKGTDHQDEPLIHRHCSAPLKAILRVRGYRTSRISTTMPTPL